jgi:hypothetical protein
MFTSQVLGSNSLSFGEIITLYNSSVYKHPEWVRAILYSRIYLGVKELSSRDMIKVGK